MTDIYEERRQDAEDFLAHYGKKGMKWGHRKALAKAQLAKDLAKKPGDSVNRAAASAKYKENIKSAKHEVRKEKGEAMIERAGGSVKKAAWGAVGLGVTKQVLLSVGSVGLQSLTNNPSLKIGISAAAQLASYASLASDINKGINLNVAKNANK